MKDKRQKKILEIIDYNMVETQEQLSDYLKQHGFNSTQATISRDIKEMRLVKELTPEGTYRYVASHKSESIEFGGRLNKIFKESVKSLDFALNIVVLKTYPGLAMAACSALDSMELTTVLGTIAGDDTCMIVMRDQHAAEAFCNEIQKMI